MKMDILSRRLSSLSVFMANSIKCTKASNHFLIPLACSAKFCDLPVINTPQKMVQKLEKIKDRRKQEQHASRPRKRGPLIISCQRKSYNFHRNEHFKKKEDFFKLASCGWRNRKRNGDSFTLVPHADNPSIQQDIIFEDLGLNEQLCERLRDIGCETPTQIQRLAIPPFLRGDNIICAAETGSGKTFSYLLPAIERISHQKEALRRRGAGAHGYSNVGSPHTVIVIPTRELTEQVMTVAESLTSSSNVIPRCAVGGALKKSDFKDFLNQPMDILITTPGILNRLLDAKCVKKSNLQSIIIDESDTLLDDSFVEDIHHIINGFQMSISGSPTEHDSPFLGGVQLVLVSATMPRDLQNTIGHIIPVELMNKVTTDGLHHLMPHVRQTFHRINPDSKPEKFIPLLKTSLDRQEVCLVFVKNSPTSFYLKKLLRDNGVDCLIMNGELTAKEREGIYSQFKEGYSDVLVATDIASRGLDTTNVHHVINYDFPGFVSDYVHRVGRVGRMGAKHNGRVTSFVSHKWDVELLWKIETAARMGTRLENVNANIKRRFQGTNDDDVYTVKAMP